MSLTTFKKKAAIVHGGTKRSARAPGGVWLSRGPFRGPFANPDLTITPFGPVGFSLNGSHRNIGGVGRDMKMSKSGTPYRGTQPVGWGGTFGTYPSATLVGAPDNVTAAVPNALSTLPVVQPVLNARVVDTMGTQHWFVKPTVLTTYGLLDKKNKQVLTGQYPCNWVQPNYTGNQTDTASQAVYIRDKAAAHTTELDVNHAGLYEGYCRRTSPMLCAQRTPTKFTFDDLARNAPYTKTLYQPVSYDTYQQRLTRRCSHPVGPQKPFPFAVRGGSSQSAAGTSITSFASGCNAPRVYLTPPAWYWYPVRAQTVSSTSTGTSGTCDLQKIAQKIPFA